MSNRKQKDWQQARIGNRQGLATGKDWQQARIGDDTRIGERLALIAEFQGRIWTCIYTLREDRIRIISIRRARHEEEIRYHLG